MADIVDEQCVTTRGTRADFRVRTRGSVPVRPLTTVEIGAAERNRLEAIAAHLLADEPALGDPAAFGPGVRAGLLEDGPALALEDHGGLRLFVQRQGSPIEYRARLLAGDGDYIALAGQPDPVFEAYCEDVLGIGHVERLIPPPSQPPVRLPQALLQDTESMGRLVAAARREGGMSLIPYYGNGGSWLLAREIAARSGADVRVAAPPPRLTRRANDKLWFAGRVADVLGGRSLPATRYAYGPAALAGELRRLASRHERVTVKVPDSAGSRGNICISSEDILSRSAAALRVWLISMLRGLTWDGQFPLLAGVWDTPTIGSPSVQLWVPGRYDGAPVVAGVFRQVIEGPRGTFVGAEPTDLPAKWMHRLAEEAVRLATLLQALGYYGPCSLDAVLAGQSLDEAELHWIECNGRWGGVSVPMILANRLVDRDRPFGFVVVQRETAPYRPLPTQRALELLDDILFRPARTAEGVVLLTPRLTAEGHGLHFMAIAETTGAARVLARLAAERLMGVG